MPSKKEGKLNQLELFETKYYINKEILYKAPYNAFFAILYGNKAKDKRYRQKIYEVEQLSFVLKNLYYDWDNYISRDLYKKSCNQSNKFSSPNLTFKICLIP